MTVASGGPTLGQRLTAGLVMAAGWLACRLPAAPVARLFAAVGVLHHALARSRRELARANLQRICRYLVAADMATPRVAAAARDDRALEALVRDAFRHHARYYLEVLRAPALAADARAGRLVFDDPAVADEALGTQSDGPGVLWVGLHFGSLELPAAYASLRGVRAVVAPMETLANAPLQAWLTRMRGNTVGMRIIPAEGSGPQLVAALEQGQGVALVADRDLTGSGRPVTFFGAPARLPVGPALLAVQSGAPCYLVGVRRVGWNRYAGRVERLNDPGEGSVRERVAAFMDQLARAYERVIADAPEQWWTTLFPIWDAAPAEQTQAAGATA